MRRPENPQRHPTAALDRDVEGEVIDLAVRDDRFSGHGLAIDNQLDGRLPGGPDARALDVPVRRVVIGKVVERRVRHRVKIPRRLRSYTDGRGRVKPDLARIRSNLGPVDAEVHKVALAFGDVAAARADGVQPGAVAERPRDFGVDAALPHAAVGDAGEIGLAGDPRAEPDVQRLVPDVELPKVGCIHGRYEVDRVGVSHVHDIFIGADAVEPGHLIVRQVARFHRQSPAGVREAHHRALRLAPAQNRQVPGGPVLGALGTGIVLLGQPQQHEVAGAHVDQALRHDQPEPAEPTTHQVGANRGHQGARARDHLRFRQQRQRLVSEGERLRNVSREKGGVPTGGEHVAQDGLRLLGRHSWTPRSACCRSSPAASS